MKEGTVLRTGGEPAPEGGLQPFAVTDAADIVRPFANGQWLYRGVWARLLRGVQEHCVRRLEARLGFEEWIFPRVIPQAALQRFQLTHYRPGMLFGVRGWEEGSDAAGILDPVQCVSLYHHLTRTALPPESLPIRIVECLGGWTWRNEDAHEFEGPVRAREFLRVESVFIGVPDDVRRLRAGVEEILTELLTDLGLTWRVVVGAGCMEIPSLLHAADVATGADEVPVHDLEVLVEPGRWLEISGCTVEGAHLVDRFEIRAQGGDALWSGCCGLGLNRLVYCFLTRYGDELDRWPPAARRLARLEAPAHAA